MEHWFRAFGVTMASVCIPFFFLIGSLDTNKGMEAQEMDGNVCLGSRCQRVHSWSRQNCTRSVSFESNRLQELAYKYAGNPRTFRRSRTISLTAGRLKTRKAKSGDDKPAPAFGALRVFTHARLGQVDQLSVDITIDERRLSGQSFSKARMLSVTSVLSAEEGTFEEIEMECSSSLWGRISNRMRSDVGHPDNV